MIDSVKEITSISFNEYEKMKRVDWVLNRCGMAVLCMDMVFWTSSVESAIPKGV
jgi:dynein heavy chain